MGRGKTILSKGLFTFLSFFLLLVQPVSAFKGEAIKAVAFAVEATQRECAADLEMNRENSSKLFCAVTGLAGVLMTAHSLYEYHLYRSGQKQESAARTFSIKGLARFLTQSGTIGLEHYYRAIKDSITNNKHHLHYLLSLTVANLLQFNWLKARYYFRNYSALHVDGKEDIRLPESSPEMTDSHKACVICLEDFKQGKKADFHAFCPESNKHLLHQECAQDIVAHAIGEHKTPECPECRSHLSYNFFRPWYDKLLASFLMVPDKQIDATSDGDDSENKSNSWHVKLNEFAVSLDKHLKQEEKLGDPTKVKSMLAYVNDGGQS